MKTTFLVHCKEKCEYMRSLTRVLVGVLLLLLIGGGGGTLWPHERRVEDVALEEGCGGRGSRDEVENAARGEDAAALHHHHQVGVRQVGLDPRREQPRLCVERVEACKVFDTFRLIYLLRFQPFPRRFLFCPS